MVFSPIIIIVPTISAYFQDRTVIASINKDNVCKNTIFIQMYIIIKGYTDGSRGGHIGYQIH